MKKRLSFLAAAGIATVALLSVPSHANAQVAFGGTVRGPHGAFSIGIGPFVPRVGAFVPAPYFDEVYLDPDYGYGFYYDSEWIPCTRYGSRWIIARGPVVYRRPVIYSRDYAYGRGYVRPNRDRGRAFVQRDFGRQNFDSRRDFGRRDSGRQNFDSRRDFGRRDSGRQNFDSRRDQGGRPDGNRRSDRGNHRGWDRR